MVFHGHLQRRADNRLVALELPTIDTRGTVQLIDSASALDEHPACSIPLDRPAGPRWARTPRLPILTGRRFS
jgi:hypothetical protein